MRKGKKTTEKLKHYLRGAKYYRGKADYLSDKLQELRSQAEKMTTSYSDAPTFGGFTDHRQDVIDEMVDKQRKYKKCVEQCEYRLQEIQLFIDNLEDYKERAVCEYYYIYFEDWQTVAIQLHYTERQIHNIHSSALMHLLEIHKKMMDNGANPLF